MNWESASVPAGKFDDPPGDGQVEWREVSLPARGGDVIRLFLTRSSVPGSSFPAVASSFAVELIFDLCMAIPIMAFELEGDALAGADTALAFTDAGPMLGGAAAAITRVV